MVLLSAADVIKYGPRQLAFIFPFKQRVEIVSLEAQIEMELIGRFKKFERRQSLSEDGA